MTRHSFHEKSNEDMTEPAVMKNDANPWPNNEDDEIASQLSHAESIEEQHDQPTLTGKSQSTQPGPARSILSRTVSRRSAASLDPGPPPDGGFAAWTQCFCTHLTIASTFGYITSFGVFQTYYQTALNVEQPTISWIGSVQLFLLFFIGTVSGRATDAGLFRYVYILGSVFQLVGIFCTAQATTFWQLFLAQAVCSGIANGLHFCPAMSLLTTYFARRRAFAVGFAALGSCTGGIAIPIIVQQLLPRIGFPWTVRVIGFFMLATNAITITLYRTRLPLRKSGPIIDWPSLKEAPYVLYVLAMFFVFWGLYFAFFYIGAYGRNVLDCSYQQSINLLLTVVSVGFIFRLVPNYFADRVGTLNTLIPFAFLCGTMMFAWTGIHSLSGMFVFAAIYGSGSAAIQALFPALFGSLSKVPDMKKAGVRMGMAFSCVSFACLTGPPLAGALIQRRDGDYLYAQVWAGTSFFLGVSTLRNPLRS
ncbi:MFS monocarboxylate transporter like protein [Zymoseptoria brevis]|uniref:MFS monocarboxylate transporter like protein n=1 Tax=Zymoseptoria brevis TaxID=1047168 RepID=A0A0F4GYK8_9PEZI|nr:MFS monocarboxylate transporter like protein [Zymoseptoria brevis]